MAMTGLDSFDTSIQKSEQWLKEIMDYMGWTNRRWAYAALRAVMLAIRDLLTVDESANFSAQLPLVIRGLYYDRWKPSAVPVKMRHLSDFLRRIASELRSDMADDAEVITRAVLRTISDHVTQGEIDDIRSMFPGELKQLWDVPLSAVVE